MLKTRLKQKQGHKSGCKKICMLTPISPNLDKYPVGLKLHGYEVTQTSPIPEFSLTAVSLKHTESGATHLHLDSLMTVIMYF